LGRGLSSLIPDRAVHETAAGGPVLLRVPIDRVARNPDQPREDFHEPELEALADSIRAHGLLQPLLVRDIGGEYRIVAGERRWRAAGRAGLTEVPVLVTDKADREQDALLLALVENLQRSDLNPVEEAHGFARLVETYGLTQQQVADRVGRDRTTVTNALRLLRLPPRALEALRGGLLSTGHGKALLGLSDPALLPDLLLAIVEQGLSVRATEKRVGQLNGSPPKKRSSAAPHYALAEELLTRQLGADVQIKARPRGGGRIVIRYSCEEELTQLVDRLGTEER
jgi:ParB family transcriptional regulator, chromosome partitioning protein